MDPAAAEVREQQRGADRLAEADRIRQLPLHADAPRRGGDRDVEDDEQHHEREPHEQRADGPRGAEAAEHDEGQEPDEQQQRHPPGDHHGASPHPEGLPLVAT